MIRNIELEDAVEILLSKVRAVDLEYVNILDALGRTLAKDIEAGINVPSFNRSPLDGYAVKAKDIKMARSDNPVKLKVIGQAPAGSTFNEKPQDKTAIRIMTGGMIPEGYDTIIKKEATDDGLDYVNIYMTSNAYDNFVKAGEDIRKGEKILSKGTVINSGAIGVCASLGIEKLEVFKKPRIGVISTGSELRDITEELEEGKIYNSNLYTITSSLLENNCIPINLGIAGDNIDEISRKIKDNIDDCDLIISTGGASVGDYDLINKVYEDLGAGTLFWRVNMKPGTPALAADYNGKLLIGLSGNPGAALITFETIARPVIKKMTGTKNFERTKVIGTMMDEFNRPSSQRRFTRVRVEIENDKIEVYLSGKQNPGVLRSMISCNGLIDILPDSEPLEVGQDVEVILLGLNEEKI